MTDWSYNAWPSPRPKWHDGAHRAEPWDTMDHHVDLGCGTLKKGRIGIDRYPAPGVNVVMDLDTGCVYSVASSPGEDAPRPDWDVPPHNWGEARLMRQVKVVSLGLPFEDNQIESIISHHALEHIGEGFIPLMDDIYRVLKPGGIFRVIVPLFPSHSAVSDADHCRYFMEGTFDAFCGTPGDGPNNCWLSSFSVPYTKARFEKLDEDMTPRCAPEEHWTREDAREMRVTLRAMK